jgi:type I restriction enzyme S subunit
MDELFKMLVLLPSLPEQKRIAAKVQELMSELERARTACEKQLEAINALPQAILRKAFSGELYTVAIESHWVYY